MMLLIFIHYKTSPEKSEKLLRINHLPCSGKGALLMDWMKKYMRKVEDPTMGTVYELSYKV